MKVLGFLGAIVLFVGVGLFFTAMSYYNQGVSYETRLEAVWDNNRAVLNNYTNKVREAAQVPTMYTNDLKEVMEMTLSARYGDSGSTAAMQWIQENNPNFDSSMYRQIQQIIESGRNDFLSSQNMLIDVKRSYQAMLGYAWSGFWLKMFGYPKVDLSKYKVIVSSDVETKFNTGTDDVIRIR